MSTADVKAAPAASKQPFGRWMATVGFKHLLAWVAIAYAIFPILYVLSSSLNPSGSLTGSNQLFRTISIENFVRLFSLPARPYAAWFGNSLFIGIVTSVGTVFMGALAAYAFSRMRFAGRRVGLMSLLLVQMFPQLLAMVAIFLLLITLGSIFPVLGIGSRIALIMVYLGGALGVNTWLMYGFFNTVPISLDESARVDGAGHARIFFTIILRLVAPILAVVALLSFIGTFNEYVLASVILTDPSSQTLPVGLYAMVSEETSTLWPVFAAGAVLAAIPMLVLFLYLQKYIVSGLTAGAVK